jgi:hypothetical protein
MMIDYDKEPRRAIFFEDVKSNYGAGRFSISIEKSIWKGIRIERGMKLYGLTLNQTEKVCSDSSNERVTP